MHLQAQYTRTCSAVQTRCAFAHRCTKAEVGVQAIEHWILAQLRDRTFLSLAELNQAIRELLAELNDKPMEDYDRSRREFFDLLDRLALKPLPAQPYEFAVWKMARVHIDYHVEFEHHYYSVPYALIHQEVELRATAETCFCQAKPVPFHLDRNTWTTWRRDVSP